jgi:hypothetical protein
MFDHSNFEEVFSFNPGYSYESSEVETIEANRRKLEGLFVDKVLKALDIKKRKFNRVQKIVSLTDTGLKAAKLYPPKTNSDLRALHQAITAGNGVDYIKLGALYYLLLDCDAHTRGRKHSDTFEEISLLSKGHQICMKGLWHMDRLEFEVRTLIAQVLFKLPSSKANLLLRWPSSTSRIPH